MNRQHTMYYTGQMHNEESWNVWKVVQEYDGSMFPRDIERKRIHTDLPDREYAETLARMYEGHVECVSKIMRVIPGMTIMEPGTKEYIPVTESVMHCAVY